MTLEKKRICIIAFKPVRTTIHVLRQIDYFSRDFDLTVIGYGTPDPNWPVTWCSVPEPPFRAKVSKLFWYAAGRILPSFYDAWYWNAERHKQAYQQALSSGAGAFHANDWQSLPIAVEAARRTGASVIFHMHEYAEQERDNDPLWRLLVAPAVRYLIRKYVLHSGVRIDASITVCEPIAERYRRELGLDPIVVYNAPKPVDFLPRDDSSTGDRIRLIHHGYAKRGRGLHRMIQMLALADQRYTLDFMLVEDDRGYIDELKKLADRLAPGRVHFRKPVAPNEIVRSITEYDMGFVVIEPTTYNNLMMLPNKLFEYIQAGLAVCVGPSPAMVSLVQQHGLGVVAASFEPRDVAETLNQVTTREMQDMKRAARRSAAVLNADVEMGKVVTLYYQLFANEREAARGEGDDATEGGALSRLNKAVR